MTQDISLRVALDRAAYALFQLKRFADMPKAAVEFCREAHLEACEVLDKDFRSAPTEVVASDDLEDLIELAECAAANSAKAHKLGEEYIDAQDFRKIAAFLRRFSAPSPLVTK